MITIWLNWLKCLSVNNSFTHRHCVVVPLERIQNFLEVQSRIYSRLSTPACLTHTPDSNPMTQSAPETQAVNHPELYTQHPRAVLHTPCLR